MRSWSQTVHVVVMVETGGEGSIKLKRPIHAPQTLLLTRERRKASKWKQQQRRVSRLFFYCPFSIYVRLISQTISLMLTSSPAFSS